MVEARREQERRERASQALVAFAIADGYRAKRYDSRKWFRALTGEKQRVDKLSPTLQEVYQESVEQVRRDREKARNGKAGA